MTNTNTLEGIRCPECGNADAFEVEILTRAIVIDNGVDTIHDPHWEDDAGTRCKTCGYDGEWRDFKEENQRPYSVCVNCGETIYWHDDLGDDGLYVTHNDEQQALSAVCSHGDELTAGTYRRHQPVWLTLGELRHRTRDLPDTTPITIAVGDGDNWHNARLDQSSIEEFKNEGNPSIILDAMNDFDTRQW